jgi:hypothetical protein
MTDKKWRLCSTCNNMASRYLHLEITGPTGGGPDNGRFWVEGDYCAVCIGKRLEIFVKELNALDVKFDGELKELGKDV